MPNHIKMKVIALDLKDLIGPLILLLLKVTARSYSFKKVLT